MPPASRQNLSGRRDLRTPLWDVIPLPASVFFINTPEIKKARRSGDGKAAMAALLVIGMKLNAPQYHHGGRAHRDHCDFA